MNEVEKKEYYSSLYDLYANLLTQKQRQYFEDYYFNDLSLFEIADNNGVSRNAIHDQLKKVVNILIDYENKLGLLKKEKNINNILDDYSNTKNTEVIQLINKIKEME